MSCPKEAYFERFYQASLAALEQARAHRVTLGGLPFSFEFSGPALERALLPALSHWPTCHEDAPIRVLMWEGAGAPPPPADWFVPAPRGEISGWSEEESASSIRACQNLDARSACLWNSRERIAIYWCASADNLPVYEQAAPLRNLWQWIFSAQGGQLCHGAVVGLRGKGILLAGKGGSGKSTTALTCLARGWDYVGDDYVLLMPGSPTVAHALFGTAKMSAPMEGDWARQVDDPVSGKRVYWLRSGLTASLPLSRIVLPQVARVTRSLPCSRMEALRAVAPSSLFQLAGASALSWRRIQSLTGNLPASRLELGPDPEQIVDSLSCLV